jgi:mRNA-degrading endonuclease toxin of MazEF toxin-antitoxin module
MKKPTAGSRPARFATWDVVIVPFPHTDRNADKRRPALVISIPDLEKDHSLIWLMMITSRENRGWRGDVAISDHQEIGLPSPSIIRPAKLATVDAALIVRRLLDPADRAAVLKSFRYYVPRSP